MFKKLLIGLAPLLATAPLAVMPAAAQAAIQHWYKNAVSIPPTETIPFVWWGNQANLNQTSGYEGPGSEVNCRSVGDGTIENPGGGGAGVGAMTAAAFYECKAAWCEEKVKALTGMEGREAVEAVNMPASINGHVERRAVPWFMQLEESTVAGVLSVRLKIGEPWTKLEKPSPPGMIRLKERCEIAATEVAGSEAEFEGELKPEIGLAKAANLNGTSSSKPSQMKFSGVSTGELHSGGYTPATYSESLKYLGYNSQELITVKP